MIEAASVLDVAGVVLEADGRRLLDGACLRMVAGEVVGLSGDSGAGKSMLAWAILGLLPTGVARVAGSVQVAGTPLDDPDAQALARGRLVGLLVQDAMAALDPTCTIGRQVRTALHLVDGRHRTPAAAATQWLARVGLDRGLADRYPHELSGGQAQRAALALVLCGGPRLLIADEPTASLDPGNAANVMELLRDHARGAGCAVLLISHDRDVLAAADRRLRLAGGRIGPAPSLPEPRAVHRPPRPDGVKALRLDRVGHRYGSTVALADVSLALATGEAVAVMGPSGSGKSTLARIAAGLIRPASGQVWRHGRAAMVFQDATEALDPRWPVARSIAEPLTTRGAQRRDQVQALAAMVGLDAATATRLPIGLSGGELQRAAIARALACDASLLVCDEPTSALDPVARAAILALLSRLQVEIGFALLFVTHDATAAAAVADRVVRLDRGHVAASVRSA